MKTVGIVAEYNPFHTGHEYHLKKAKEAAGADYAVVVMSPDYVQRGEPAVFDKYTRTEMALRCGADLVLELPVCYATGSAEYFAQGAVTLLDRLGVVDTLCFGAETDDLRLLTRTAALLSEEPAEYRTALKEGLRRGLTFPQARSAAAAAYLSKAEKAEAKSVTHLLKTPNNILGIEYCRAIRKCQSSMTALPIRRTGSCYSSPDLSGPYCSATAVRARIPAGDLQMLLPYIPENCRDLFQKACRTSVIPEDLLSWLTLRLLDETRRQPLLPGPENAADFSRAAGQTGPLLAEILDFSPELADRAANLQFSLIGKSFAEITALLKTKQITEARIRRALLHLILDIRTKDVESFRENGTVFYARILGLRQASSPLLREIKKRSTLPLITKTARAPALHPYGQKMWALDLYASHLYRSIGATRHAVLFRSEYEISPVVL